MAKLLSDLCDILAREPAALAITLFLLFCAIGGTWTMGIRGRRRLWKDKVDKEVFTEKMDDFKITMARIEKRVWDLGTQKKQDPLPPETMELINNDR